MHLGHDVELITGCAYQPALIHKGNFAGLLLVNFGF